MEGTRENSEYRKNTKNNFTLSVKREKINRMSNEKMGGKYETVAGHLV
jgi:hypothetical protein